MQLLGACVFSLYQGILCLRSITVFDLQVSDGSGRELSRLRTPVKNVVQLALCRSGVRGRRYFCICYRFHLGRWQLYALCYKNASVVMSLIHFLRGKYLGSFKCLLQ